jgi:hypothetical protein
MAAGAFYLVLIVYVLTFAAIITLGVLISFKTHGKIPTSKEEIRTLAANAKSPWNPFGEIGGTRWRNIIFGLFILLVVLNFVRA